MVYKWLNNSLSLFYPASCHLCDVRLPAGQTICLDCQAELPILRQRCQQCGSSLSTANGTRCGACISSPPHFQRTFSPFAYRPPISHLIMALKYQRRLALIPTLSTALARCVQPQQQTVDALLPVPLHVSKLRQRGFNQALELTRPLARRFGLPIMQHIERHKPTVAQSTLQGYERQKNVRNAFHICQPFQYPRIAIVDDVMTTGSTVNEIARLLAGAGVEEIQVWCIARA